MNLTLEQCNKLIRSDKPKEHVIRIFREAFSEQKNFEVFCRFCLGKAFKKPFCQAHKEVISTFMKPGNSAVAMPRGHGKSTLVGLGYLLWFIVNRKKKYIVYTSQNHSKSEAFLEPIREECKTNPILRYIYPGLNTEIVRDDKGKDRTDMFDVMDTRVHALSFEKNIRGLRSGVNRPDLIILDDIEDDQRVLNPDLRRKDRDKLNKQIIPAMDAQSGEYKFVGTILHQNSLLMEKLNLHQGRIFCAAEGKPGEWNNILWEAQFPSEKLDELYREMGSVAFESEMMNNPVDNASSLIKREWIEACYDQTISYYKKDKYARIIQGVDFAFSDRTVADSSVFYGLGKLDQTAADDDWSIYITLWCEWKQGLSVTAQFDHIEYISGVYGVDDNALEENSIRSMSAELMHYTFPRTLYWMGANDPSEQQLAKRSEENMHQQESRWTVGKINTIKRLGTMFENKRIILPYQTPEDREKSDRIRDELLTFALQDGKLVETGVHSDVGPALALAIECGEQESFEAGWGFV